MIQFITGVAISILISVSSSSSVTPNICSVDKSVNLSLEDPKIDLVGDRSKVPKSEVSNDNVVIFTIDSSSTKEDLKFIKSEIKKRCQYMSIKYIKKRTENGKLIRVGLKYEYKSPNKDKNFGGKFTYGENEKMKSLKIGVELNTEKEFLFFLLKIDDDELTKIDEGLCLQ